jgi:ribosomal protein L37AE/L43A
MASFRSDRYVYSERYEEQQPNGDHGGECPGCSRIMSRREAAEQGECNDCHPGGAWSPDGYYGYDEPRW